MTELLRYPTYVISLAAWRFSKTVLELVHLHALLETLF